MSRLTLPLLDGEPSPALASTAKCRDWLAGLTLTNPPQAQALLAREVEVLSRAPLPARERLQVLELLREPIAFVQNECAKRFAGKPLPLAEAERGAFDAGQALWQLLTINYLHCLQSAEDGAAQDLAALSAQRALAASAAALLDHWRAAMVAAPALWQLLHSIYAAAEALQATAETVNDPQAYGGRSTAAAAYVEPLLLSAAQPFGLSQKQLGLVAYWSRRWASKVSIGASKPGDIKTPPLVVDLQAGQGGGAAEPTGAEGEYRWLELSALRRSLRHRLKALREGETPEALELGKDCVQPACQALLLRVYRLWCKPSRPAPGRRPAQGPACQLVAGIEAIHYHLSGQIFRQPGHAVRLSKREHDEIATFGRIATRHEDNYDRREGFMLEPWQMTEASSELLYLTRPLGQPGTRLCAGQLVGTRPVGEARFMLGVLSSVAVDVQQCTVHAAVRVLPGTPVAVALRGTGITALNEKFRQGLRLPAVEKRGERTSLVMPAGVFRPGRIVEIYSDQARQVRLSRLLTRGSNFERADFEWA